MTTTVLYRKYRPRSFAELAGQDVVSRTLTNAIAGGKVAHAYLFSGPRGTGKTTMGRLLAKAVNCRELNAGEPCNSCEPCRAYLEGSALDLVELDAASNRGIDEIRNLREKANFAPAGGPDAYKVYLVDEVHMLTEPAFNALLKTLEEPPAHVIFVLATTEVHKVPATVISRCQRFDFRRIPLAASVSRLSHIAGEEKFEVPADALEAIARSATGSLRDAINLLEQLVDSYGKVLTLEQVREGLGLVVDARSAELAAQALRGELAQGLGLISAVRDEGIDLRQFQRQVVAHLRGLLLAKADAPPSDTWTEDQLAEMRSLVADVPQLRIVAALRAFGDADLRADPLSPLPLELALAGLVVKETPEAVPAPAAPASSQPPAPQPRTPAKRPPAASPAPKPAAARSASKAKQADSPPVAAPGTDRENGEQPAATPDSPQPAATPKSAQPAAAPESAPQVARADETPELAAARERWPEIYERTRELEFRAGALLNSGCGIIEASPDEIVFGFRFEMLLQRMQGDGGENIRALQQAVDDVLGTGREVRCVLAPDVEVQKVQRGGHLVRAAEEMGGQILPNDA